METSYIDAETWNNITIFYACTVYVIVSVCYLSGHAAQARKKRKNSNKYRESSNNKP